MTDRQAADAVRAQLDWKYALSLPLTDAGFDASVLCAFRARLLDDNTAERLLDVLLTRLKDAGVLGNGNRARSDSTRVLAAVRTLNRLELVTETMRAALEALAVTASAWLTRIASTRWFDRYERKADAFRLPVGDGPRLEYALTIGADGFTLLTAVFSPDAPSWLRELPAISVLRRIWMQH
ncbi:transposase [Streptacidiphilus rugosus]|uniref:transposase n=1 Tax=Streptacidiphilus rugosus TaxID=405783 RepID=UPI000A41A355|nr:transposase [Streptacidiphilus rugosus]